MAQAKAQAKAPEVDTVNPGMIRATANKADKVAQVASANKAATNTVPAVDLVEMTATEAEEDPVV